MKQVDDTSIYFRDETVSYAEYSEAVKEIFIPIGEK